MRRLAVCGAVAALALCATPALGSGDAGPYTVYVDRNGGTPAELARLYEGRVGVVLPSSPTPLLYLEWRLLNGLRVGTAAGAGLSVPCCDISAYPGPHGGVSGWLEAFARVGGTGDGFIVTDRPGPDYTTIPNCFRDAFDVATATLNDRSARYGGATPAVRAWAATQSAVFAACGGEHVRLPAPLADAPAWLRADRAYQEAAFAFYDGQEREALDRFTAIGRDAASPWRPRSLYLQVRVIQRHALRHPNPTSFASARAAIDKLAAARPGTYGQGEVRGLRRTLAYRDRPAQLLAELDGELHAREPVADLATGLHDYVALTEHRTPLPDIADWMATMRSFDRVAALDHARERWGATRSPVWLIAALSLTRASDPAAAALAADAARVPHDDPAWLTAQYHQLRLTLGHADDAALRPRVDAILGQPLTHTDRNIFRALRTQLATDRADFVRFALREPYCSDPAGVCERGGPGARSDPWLGIGGTGRYVAFGGDARAILDRLPLGERMAVAEDARLPPELRLDLTLTSYARAVQLQDDRALDRLARDLARMLPEMRRDWLAVATQRPGESKRFAEFFVLAKIPGVHPDLADDTYTRPVGTVRNYQGRWWDWMIVPAGTGAGMPGFPSWSRYNPDAFYYASSEDDAAGDLTCNGKCGAGGAPLHLPRFAAAGTQAALAERKAFVFYDTAEGAKPVFPAGTVSAWEALLRYASAHPRDPRAPEALYWLIRISRRGQHHDRIGYRAFRLLHARYAGNPWTTRSPYYFD